MYHSGDTCIYEGMYSKLRNWNKIDVMFIPINGRDAKRYRENLYRKHDISRGSGS